MFGCELPAKTNLPDDPFLTIKRDRKKRGVCLRPEEMFRSQTNRNRGPGKRVY